jgi:hypothetical protein
MCIWKFGYKTFSSRAQLLGLAFNSHSVIQAVEYRPQKNIGRRMRCQGMQRNT